MAKTFARFTINPFYPNLKCNLKNEQCKGRNKLNSTLIFQLCIQGGQYNFMI